MQTFTRRGLTLLRWVPLFFWTSVIFKGSTETLSAPRTSRILEPFLRWLIPSIDAEMIAFAHMLARKGGHVAAYAVLAGFWWLALGTLSRCTLERLTRWTLLLTLLYAAADEFHQSFYASRGPAVADVGLDFLGATLAVCGIRLVLKWRSGRLAKAALPTMTALERF